MVCTKVLLAEPRGFCAGVEKAIKALGWPGMTMTFAVRDKSMLAEVRAGNAVNFDLAKDPSGQYVVTRMTAAK